MRGIFSATKPVIIINGIGSYRSLVKQLTIVHGGAHHDCSAQYGRYSTICLLGVSRSCTVINEMNDSHKVHRILGAYHQNPNYQWYNCHHLEENRCR